MGAQETPAHDQLKANQTGTVPGPTLSPGPCQHPHSRPLVFHVFTARCPFPKTVDGCPSRAQGLPPARGLVVGRCDKKLDGFSWHQIPGMETRTSVCRGNWPGTTLLSYKVPALRSHSTRPMSNSHLTLRPQTRCQPLKAPTRGRPRRLAATPGVETAGEQPGSLGR